MAAKILFFVVIAILINVCHSQNSVTVTTPTSGNSTHQYFNTSSTLNYTYDTIICGRSYCHVTCDESNGCYELNIDASLSDTLIVECTKDSSCEYFSIQKGPITTLDVTCSGHRSCYRGDVQAPTTINVHLLCNYYTTTIGDAGCYNLQFDASNASIVNIECTQRTSCFSVDFDASWAGYVSLYAFNYEATNTMYLYAYNVQNGLDITCYNYGCNFLHVYANTIQGPVNLNCSSWLACWKTYLFTTDSSSEVTINCKEASVSTCDGAHYYCPAKGICNIYCGGNSACEYAYFYIPDINYAFGADKRLNLDCPDPDSCGNTDITCLNNNRVSALVFNTSSSSYECDNSHCCPFKKDEFKCAPASDCYVDCNNATNIINCVDLRINGTLANSLTVDCAGTSCNGSLILCPTSDNTACHVDCNGGSCNYAAIQTGTDNSMNEFKLECGYVQGCKYLDVNIDSISITDLVIDCSNTYACRYTSIEIASNITNDFNLSCSQRKSCYGLDIVVAIGDTAHVYCVGEQSCDRAALALSSTASDVNFDINCNNPLQSNASTQSACSDAEFNIYGFMESSGVTRNNVTIQCGVYDCYQAVFNGENLFNADANCADSYSCNMATINMRHVVTFYLNCGGNYACGSSIVNCPYKTENICEIVCDGQNGSCNGMQLQVPDEYVFGYLNLTCFTGNSCLGLDVDCDGSLYTEEYVYNDVSSGWECMNGGVAYCCPYWKGDVIACPVDCSIDNCAMAFIDCKYSSYSTINCGASECMNSLIHCPIEGCVINCIGTDACNGVNVLYSGVLTDNGRIHINCTGAGACSIVTIDAEYIDQIDISCNYVGGSNGPCYAIEFNAQYSNKVVIDLRGYLASYYGKWNVDNAKSVSLTARGFWSFYGGWLKAESARSSVISLFSDATNYATYSASWWIPTNATINCHGTGCYNLNNIYRNSPNTSGFDINIYSCGQCHSIGECIYYFQLVCDDGTDYFDEIDLCNNYDNCGCQETLIDSYFAPFIGQECYSPYTTSAAPTIPSKSPTGTPTTSSPTYPTTHPTTASPATTEPSTYPSIPPTKIVDHAAYAHVYYLVYMLLVVFYMRFM